ncbi:hypothetical protein Tco_0590609 [Tanacetum coccineum]
MKTSNDLRVIRIILVIVPEHQSDTKVIHNDDGNPSKANIKQALGRSILMDLKEYIKMDVEVKPWLAIMMTGRVVMSQVVGDGYPGCDAALETLSAYKEVGEKASLMKKAYSTLIQFLGDRVLWEVTKETTAAGIWIELTSLYITKSLKNRLYLKKKLYTYYMSPCIKLGDHIYEFNKLILDLPNIDIEIKDEDQALMLLTLLPSSYEKFVEKFLYGWESLTIEDVQMTLNSRELNKRTKGTKEESGDGLYVRGRPYHSEGHLKRECPMKNSSRYVRKGGSYHMTPKKDFLYDFKGFDGGLIQLGDNRSLISLGTLKKDGYIMKMRIGRMKEIKGCQGAQRNREAEVLQVCNDDAVVAQRRLEDKKLEEKTNTDCLGAKGNVVEKKKVKESMKA